MDIYSGSRSALKMSGRLGTTMLSYLPAYGLDLATHNYKQHHTSPEQCDFFIYQSCVPPSQETPHSAKDLMRDKRGDHLTNPPSSATGGWLLLSKQGATSSLSQKPQPPPSGHSNTDQTMTNSPLQPNTFGWRTVALSQGKIKVPSFPCLAGSALLAVQPQANAEPLPLQPPQMWSKSR